MNNTIAPPASSKIARAPSGARRRLKRITISTRFRSILVECLPNLRSNPAYFQFVGYLLFGAQIDKRTGKLLLWKRILAEITGADINNFAAIRFLEAFRHEVMPPDSFAWSEYHVARKECRQLDRCIWPPRVQEALPDEFARKWHHEGRVYLDGSKFTAAKQRNQRLEVQSAANQRRGLSVDARMIQDYMNSRAPHLFTQTVKNYQAALAVARTISNDPENRSRKAQERILRNIQDLPQPMYSASRKGNTVRLTTSEAIPNLQSEVRRALTLDWVEVDLKSAQLAICAWKWQVDEVTSFLENGGNIWEYLRARLAIPGESFEQAKPVLKEALYSVCYGKSKANVRKLLSEGLVPLEIIGGDSKFVRDKLVSALFRARQTQKKKIILEGGARDCYGKWISTAERMPRRILAEVAQSYEMRLIEPIFKLAIGKEHDFQVLLYQADGVSIYFTDRSRKETLQRKITDAVAQRIAEFGIKTYLEWKA